VRRPERRRIGALLALAATILVAASSARADQAPQQKLQSVEQQLDQNRSHQDALSRQADALAGELATLRADSVQAAEAAQTHERALSDLEAQLAALGADEAGKKSTIDRDRAREADLLAALARLARNPPEALAFGPAAPEDAIRTGMLLGETVPRLEAEAQSLRIELGDLRRLRAEIARKRQATEAEQQALTAENARLDTLIQRKSLLRDQTLQSAEETGQRMQQLSAQAADLHELIERLEAERKAREEAAQREAERKAREEAALREADRRAEAERKSRLATIPSIEPSAGSSRTLEVTAPAPLRLDPSKPKTIRSFTKARGQVVFPASGILLSRYGEPNEFGISSKGLTVATRPGAVVVAPFDGQIEFAGPFKGYGQILIIQHGDGYHSLIAGLDRIDGTVGDWLVSGEPVGAMAPGEPKPRLYLELRHNGQPINPLPWLATRDEKVSG
jgi:septal ring factor EnvC (AmiA/AmiB activator)